MAPTTTPIANPAPRILRTDAGGGSAAGAVALATSAEKKKRGKKGFKMKILNNFETIRRRNPDRSAKLDGSVSESEIAGGTPRKKPRNHTLRGDCERAKCGKNRAMMPVTQDGGDDGPAEEEDPPQGAHQEYQEWVHPRGVRRGRLEW